MCNPMGNQQMLTQNYILPAMCFLQVDSGLLSYKGVERNHKTSSKTEAVVLNQINL